MPGTFNAKKQWPQVYGETIGTLCHCSLMFEMMGEFHQLQASFPDQVTFGLVGSKAPKGSEPGSLCIHIFGANAKNWNLPDGVKIDGSLQASDMGKQRLVSSEGRLK